MIFKPFIDVERILTTSETAQNAQSIAVALQQLYSYAIGNNNVLRKAIPPRGSKPKHPALRHSVVCFSDLETCDEVGNSESAGRRRDLVDSLRRLQEMKSHGANEALRPVLLANCRHNDVCTVCNEVSSALGSRLRSAS